MIGITQAQAELLAFIERYQAEHKGVCPSFEEMKQALGLHSKSGVHRIVLALEERGRLRRLPNRNRSLEIVPETDKSALADFPTVDLLAELARRSNENRRAAA